MIKPIPITCHKCGAVVVDDMQNLTGYVIQPPGISCRSCFELIIPATEIIC